MTAIIFSQVLNCTIDLIFAAVFFVIRLSYPNLRHVAWFSVLFLVGMVSPLSGVAALATGVIEPFAAIEHVALLTATVGLPIVLARIAEQPVPWRASAICLLAGAVAKVVIGMANISNTLADWLNHGAFVAAMALAAAVAGRAAKAERSRLWAALTVMLIAGAVYFLPPAYHAGALASPEDALSKNNQALAIEAIGSVLVMTSGLILMLIVMQAAVAAKSEEAETDTLTGIPNRRGFNRRAEIALLSAKEAGHILKVIMFDLDRFKAINDTHGHAKGDLVLAKFARILQAHCPVSGIVARLGGEEFVMLIERTNIAEAWSVADRVRAELENADFGIPIVTVSAGIAGIQPDDTLSSLIRRADQWVYFAKNHGRNQVCPVPG